jgi:hypothetical protein
MSNTLDAPTCTNPPASDAPSVKLVTSDDETLEVPLQVARMSETIKNLLDDIGGGDADMPIPISNVSAGVLRAILVYLDHYKDVDRLLVPVYQKELEVHRTAPECPSARPPFYHPVLIEEWDQEFCSAMDTNTLFEVMLAANYLDIPSLLALTEKTIGEMLRNKTPEAIRKQFGIVNNHTPAEELQLRKEVVWDYDVL